MARRLTHGTNDGPVDYLRTRGAVGQGSSKTRVRQLGAAELLTGTNISYTTDGTDGSKITLLRTGVWYISYTDHTTVGITKNTTGSDHTTNVTAITRSSLIGFIATGTDDFVTISVALELPAGTTLFPQTSGSPVGASNNEASFEVYRVN